MKHYLMTVKLRATAKTSHLYNLGHEPAGDTLHHETQPASGGGGGGGGVRGVWGRSQGKKPLYETTANDHKADRTNPTCTSVLEHKPHLYISPGAQTPPVHQSWSTNPTCTSVLEHKPHLYISPGAQTPPVHQSWSTNPTCTSVLEHKPHLYISPGAQTPPVHQSWRHAAS